MADDRDIYVVHDVFRREFKEIPGLVSVGRRRTLPSGAGVAGGESPGVCRRFAGGLGEGRRTGREWVRMAEHRPDRMEAPGGGVAAQVS
jgi:hypothetical protein